MLNSKGESKPDSVDWVFPFGGVGDIGFAYIVSLKSSSEGISPYVRTSYPGYVLLYSWKKVEVSRKECRDTRAEKRKLPRL